MRRRFPFPFVLCVLALTSVMSVPVWGQDSETEALRKEVEELKQRVQELEKQQAAKPEANRAATSPDESSAGAARAPLPQAAPPSQPEADQTAGSPDRTTAGAAGSLAPQMSPPVEPEASPAVTSPDQSSGPAVGQPAPQPLTPPVQRAAEPQATPSPPNPVTVLREKWRRVARNMSQAEIADVLGQPSKEIHIDSKLVWYYYYPGIGGASVFFKSNGHVSAYQGPTVGWW